LGARGLATGKKNATRRKAWIVFVDESGVSERPPIYRTWAPRGQTPVLIHPYNWNKLSVAGALAYRWDGRRCRFLFKIIEDSFKAADFIDLIRRLRRHFRRDQVTLVWDRLPGHRAVITRNYLETQKHWLRAEFLPPYAPDLNPVELAWGHAKRGDLANQRVFGLDDVHSALTKALRRIDTRLGMAFLRHTGLSLG